MALQTDRLSMIGLGVQGNAVPPDSAQPFPLADGVHLRWATRRDLGFPWYGFHLFRRPSRRFTPVCLSAKLSTLAVGGLGAATLAAEAGTVTSDANLVLTEDFERPLMPAARELDLDHRSYVQVDRPIDDPAYGVRAVIGFRGVPAGPRKQPCIDFGSVKATKKGPNPLAHQGATFQVFGKSSPLATSEMRAWTGQGAKMALVCGDRCRVLLPCVAASVTVTTCGDAGTFTVQVLDERLKVVGMKSVTSKGKTKEATTIKGKADGTGFFVFPEATPQPGDRRLALTFRRNNTTADPQSQILKQAGDTTTEQAHIDVPWGSS